MKSGWALVENPAGLHARSAATLVRCAAQFDCEITIQNNQKRASASNIMSLLMLEATAGSHLQVSTEGQDESAALAAIIALIKDSFGELKPHRE